MEQASSKRKSRERRARLDDKIISSSKLHIVAVVRDGVAGFSAKAMLVDREAILFAGFFATLCLLCGSLALIDLRRGIIPDALNLAVAGLGLVKAVVDGGAIAGAGAIAEAIVVGAIFWLFRRLYFALRKIQGLGLGDVKFLAGSAPWVGLAGIPLLLLIAALSALLAIGSAQLAGQSLTRQTSLPFGPFLALGLLSTLAAQQWFGWI